MKHLSQVAFTFFLAIFVSAPSVFAQYSSSNYKAEEVFFGAGGELETTSPSYSAQSSFGSLGITTIDGTTVKANSGFLTAGDPFLEMTVSTSLVDLGTLDTTATKTGNAAFQVRAYTDSGYVVQTIGQSPTIPSTAHSLAPMASTAASAVGTEQFGINLRANTSPASFGADPSPQPDSSFADGQAATGYSTINQYRYNNGETIAQTNTDGWGLTIFTISYIANINIVTKAGNYTMAHVLVAVPTY